LTAAFFFGAAFFTTFFAVAMTASFQIVTHYCCIIRSSADRLSFLCIFVYEMLKNFKIFLHENIILNVRDSQSIRV